jgi:thiamine biosynthesis lipoprotein
LPHCWSQGNRRAMWLTRARPLLGTVVSIQVKVSPVEAALAERAIADAFATIAHISRVMSAHDEDSDLGRLSRAMVRQVLMLDAETIRVIRAAQHWTVLSHGAFNPSGAATILARRHRRPGLAPDAAGTLSDIRIVSDTTVEVMHAVNLDFGGIAKGYAVDRAIDTLTAHGISDALVNAGGDLRALGVRAWPVDVRHSDSRLMDRRLRQKTHIREQALTTSVSGPLNPEFVLTRRHGKPRWRSVTVQASTCMAADALTKWAMQSSLLCPDLRTALRQNHGRMWRTR